MFHELDVVLSKEDIVKPDILIVCDKEKITKKNIQGTPDLIVEILSPSTSKKDKTVKLELYKKNGVKECWLVDTFDETITVFLFDDRKVKDTFIYSSDNDYIPVSLFNGELNIDLKYALKE